MAAIDLVIKGGQLPDGTTADLCIDGDSIVRAPGPFFPLCSIGSAPVPLFY